VLLDPVSVLLSLSPSSTRPVLSLTRTLLSLSDLTRPKAPYSAKLLPCLSHSLLGTFSLPLDSFSLYSLSPRQFLSLSPCRRGAASRAILAGELIGTSAAIFSPPAPPFCATNFAGFRPVSPVKIYWIYIFNYWVIGFNYLLD
jgi:hypothetical protein